MWLFDDVECCLGQLPPEPSTDHHRRGGRRTGISPITSPSRSSIARRRTRAGNPWHGANWQWPANTCISRGPGLKDRASVSGWPTDPTVHWEPYHDGIGAVPRAQPNRLVAFRNGDGWFIYNLTRNLAGSPVDRDHARRQPPPESRLPGRIDP